MKRILYTLSLLLLATACRTDEQGNGLANERKNSHPVVQTFNPDTASITRSFQTWYTYTYHAVHLAQAFVGLDADSVVNDKGFFLTKLMTGRLIPVKIKSIDGVPVYRLLPLRSPDPDITSTIQEMARNELANYKLEGTALPAYTFRDLMGKHYSPQTTRGSYLLLKCWFIHCAACVNEFPELNKLVEAQKGRSDMQFLSLALDSSPQLIAFLQRKPFRYAVVPDAEKYLAGKLGISRYPTHIVVDKKGAILKVVNSVDDLNAFLAANLPPATS